MPLDNTSLFRARVKTIQMRQAARAKKERGDAIEEIKFTDSEPVDGTFCLPPSSYSIYSSKAEEIRRCLIELRDAVVARRQDYIATVGHCRGFALSTSRGMCEWERNELDDESERAIRQCSQLIRSFERQIRSDTQLRASDEAAHLEGVARILESYLRKIAKIITELRSVRVRKTAEMKKMIRLSTLVQIHKNKLRNEALAHEGESNGDENQTKLDRFHRETSSNSAPLPQESTSGLRKRRSGEKGTHFVLSRFYAAFLCLLIR
ncbi:Syntaxin-18 [Toxocara canis]|uniref:Syntaxin-18 n=1 Tax=Toxocara canis TaxID=6265 RepID=A0A0B2VII2_TOXCA|nr:Syntaxin-18 [Toxocara canis]